MKKRENTLLLLFTTSYPYGDVVESFLDPEILHLSEAFDKVILIPESFPNSIERVSRELPENIEIEDSFLELASNKGVLHKISVVLNAITSTNFYREIINNPDILFHKSSIIKSVHFFGNAIKRKKWFQRYIESKNIDLSRTIFYTYWLSLTTSGISMTKKRYSLMKTVSRAHRGDLYNDMIYIPHRPEVIKSLNRLFLISEHGKNYVLAKYPSLKDNCEISRLGVTDPGFLTKSSSDDIFRIVSCSFIIPVKRIDLLIRGLEALCKLKDSKKFEWIHIGYGPSKLELEELADTLLPDNILHKFVGYLPKEEMISYYKNNCVDVFINVSESEGIPVSIMEAQSFGIPVIATAVGGTPEIVSNDVGLLLYKDPTPNEIAEALCNMMENKNEAINKRKNSRENWEKNYNSKKNFKDFAQTLKKL